MEHTAHPMGECEFDERGFCHICREYISCRLERHAGQMWGYSQLKHDIQTAARFIRAIGRRECFSDEVRAAIDKEMEIYRKEKREEILRAERMIKGRQEELDRSYAHVDRLKKYIRTLENTLAGRILLEESRG